MTPQLPPRAPLFVERHTYRRRRVRDAARALPVFGTMLWMVPLLWGMGDGEGPRASAVLVYLFGSWVLLAVLSGVGVYALRRAERAAERAEERRQEPVA